MTITATCGHETAFGRNIIIKGYTREGKRCLSSIVVCQECYSTHCEWDDILDTEAEEQAWVNYD